MGTIDINLSVKKKLKPYEKSTIQTPWQLINTLNSYASEIYGPVDTKIIVLLYTSMSPRVQPVFADDKKWVWPGNKKNLSVRKSHCPEIGRCPLGIFPTQSDSNAQQKIKNRVQTAEERIFLGRQGKSIVINFLEMR